MKTNFFAHCVLIEVLMISVTRCNDNIDIFEPIMRPSPEVNVTEEDLFGYKVVLHQLDLAGGIEDTRLASLMKLCHRYDTSV